MLTTLRLSLPTLFLASAAILAGCGGSSSGPGQVSLPATSQWYLFAQNSRSGTVSNSGFVGLGTDLAIGDSNLDESARGYYTFDLSAVDPQRLVSAILVTTQFNMVGAPYPDLGPDVLVESVDIGSSLDAADFGTAGTPRGSLSSDGNGSLSTDVTAAIQDLGFTSRPLTLRLSFPTLTDGNGDNDFINLVDPDNRAGATNGRPVIVVTSRN